MSTRATYQFKSGTQTLATIYIHHDGYPEGAAEYYFAPCFERFSVNSFFRANERAEITESHEIHGDTEYRYTVQDEGQDSTIVAEKRVGDWNDPSWVEFFSGKLVDFINKYGETKFKSVRLGYSGSRFMSLQGLRDRADAQIKNCEEYMANHPKGIGNIRSLQSEIKSTLSAIKSW